MISTSVHGIIDYMVGVLLIAAPFIFGFADGTAAQWIPMVLGILAIVYSLFTNYELGLAARVLPMRLHLFLDIVIGVLLAISPWLFGFANTIWWPHAVVGAMTMLISPMTRTQPAR